MQTTVMSQPSVFRTSHGFCAGTRRCAAAPFRRVAGGFVALVAVLVSAVLGSPAEKDRPIVVVGDRAYPPLEFLEDGNPHGFTVDFLKELSSVLDRDIELRLMQWNEAQEQVLNGQADALTTCSRTPAREQLFGFVQPTLRLDFAFFVRRNDTAIAQAADLAGKRVGITAGGLPRQYLEQDNTLHIVVIRDYEDGLRQLTAGKLDAVAADRWVAGYTLYRMGISRCVAVLHPPFAQQQAATSVSQRHLQSDSWFQQHQEHLHRTSVQIFSIA